MKAYHKRRALLPAIRQLHCLGKTSAEAAAQLGIGMEWLNRVRRDMDLPPFDTPPGRNTRKDAWTAREDALLRQAVAAGMTVIDASQFIGRSIEGVRKRHLKLDLPPLKPQPKPPAKNPFWTPERVRDLKALRAKRHSFNQCARVFRTGRGAIASAVYRYLKEDA